MGDGVLNELKEMAMIVPNSFSAVLFPSKKRDVNKTPLMDDPDTYKPVLYSIASVLVFKALCGGLTKNGTIKMMIDIHKGDTVKAAASLSMIQSLGRLSTAASSNLGAPYTATASLLPPHPPSPRQGRC
jgi:hypothetical protein